MELQYNNNMTIYTYYPRQVDNKYKDHRLSIFECRKFNGIECGCCRTGKPHVFKTHETFNVHLKSDMHKKKVDEMTKRLEKELIQTSVDETVSEILNGSETAAKSTLAEYLSEIEKMKKYIEDLKIQQINENNKNQKIIEDLKAQNDKLKQHIKNQNNYIVSLTDIQIL